MNLVEFQQLSKRTAPFNAAPENNQEFINILGNYSTGLVGEWFEYQQALNKRAVEKDNDKEIIKEIGDVMHYAVNLLTVMNEKLDFKKITQPTLIDMDKYLGDILEIPKKHIYHGHELRKQEYIEAVYGVISYFKTNLWAVLDVALAGNIEKLKTRCPDSFSVEDSIARKDVQG